MEELNFKFDDRTIKINGTEFKILLSDGEIYDKYAEFSTKMKSLKTNFDTLLLYKTMTSYVNELLGTGALTKICPNRMPSITEAFDMIPKICLACAKCYMDKLDSYAVKDDEE